jgi:hypothetical protein
VYSTWRENGKYVRNVVGKPEEEGPLERSGPRQRDNIANASWVIWV